jgi:hypothetical protein
VDGILREGQAPSPLTPFAGRPKYHYESNQILEVPRKFMNLSGKIETTANLATIIVAVLISTFLVKAHFFPNQIVPTTTSVLAAEVAKGTRVDGRAMGVDWKKNHRTLVLAISTTCHFCAESAPFYRRLGETIKDVKLVAVLPQPVPEAQQYLGLARVHVDEVRQIPLSTVGVRATPTLLLVSDAGVVTDIWMGKLQPEQETQVFTTLAGTKTVDIDTQTKMDPVTVSKVMVGDQQIRTGVSTAGVREVRQGTPFQAGDDWLKNMTIVIRNRTDKAIVRAEIVLLFPDTGDGTPGRPVTAYTITLGQRPEIDAFRSNGQKLSRQLDKKPFFFAPGETLVINVADYVDEIRSIVEAKLLFSQITRVVIERTQFFFEDGMRWNNLYGFGVPNPNHPGQFTNMDRSTYFPGNAATPE